MILVMKKAVFGVVTLTVLIAGLSFSEEPAEKKMPLSAVRIIEKSQLAFYYQGDDMKANVTMELIAKSGGKRTRVMSMLRRNETV